MTTGGRLSVPPETLVGLRRRLDAMPGRHPDDRVSLSVVFPLSSPLALSGEQPTLWPPQQRKVCFPCRCSAPSRSSSGHSSPSALGPAYSLPAAADVSVVIRACVPVTRKPSARLKRVAMQRISTQYSPRSTPGCRPSAGCVPISLGEMLPGFSTADRPHQHTTLPAESGPSSDCAAPSIGSSLKVWLAVAYWAELLHRGVTIGWYAWLPASRRRHPATPCSRSPLSSRPCVSAPLGVARAGIHLRSGSCLSGPDVSASFQPDIARSRNSRTTPYVGSHLLRHSLAIRLVNTGPRSTTRLAKCRSVRRSARPLQCQG